jgi:Domain of unknown function (DUF4345)
MSGLPNIALGIVAFGFALMGLGALFAPERVTRLFGTLVLTTAGRNEVRAVYGGFGVAMAGLLSASAWVPHLRLGVCTTLAVALAGMVLGRVLSALADHKLERWPCVFGGIELGGVGLLTYAA